ncbi:hypothetical protein BP6252_12767 [Coleophoma cylindrospora]|uniref:Uncharacterized protein n=1 Tax=Coleophoma cylindrospora TaxID=1849047 RepID=A0A3D8QDE6_9HELO|nr:hypothetical protein BP6252_12767 [Coleophoma cylindrospora]
MKEKQKSGYAARSVVPERGRTQLSSIRGFYQFREHGSMISVLPRLQAGADQHETSPSSLKQNHEPSLTENDTDVTAVNRRSCCLWQHFKRATVVRPAPKTPRCCEEPGVPGPERFQCHTVMIATAPVDPECAELPNVVLRPELMGRSEAFDTMRLFETAFAFCSRLGRR